MNAPLCEVVTTTGGARAMLDHETGEVMHPIVGPLVESTRLYVAPSRLDVRLAAPSEGDGDDAADALGPLVLLDVGLGAGSNAVAAWHVSEARVGPGRRLEIVSFEKNLAPFAMALEDANAEVFGFHGAAREAGRAVLADRTHAASRTIWRLVEGPLPATLDDLPAASADVVFWDPFSPRSNPALWTASAFTALRRVCREGATVHTYSGATATRSAMLLAGFAVGFGEVTGENKRATVGATRPRDLTSALDPRWLARLGRSSAAFPSDAPEDALARVTAMPQFRAE